MLLREVEYAKPGSVAEALAHEIAFLMDEPDDAETPARRVHHLPAWELKPLAHLSPPPATQAAITRVSSGRLGHLAADSRASAR